MTFELLCAVLIALLIGVAMTFHGYRWFLILLPIFGFVWGFGLGAQTMQAIFGQAMFATVTSWVVGLIVGVVFAVLSYFIYLFGVAIFAGAIGYGVAFAIMSAIGMSLNFITWLIGIVAAVALAFVVLKFNIQKYVIIIGTALAGAGVIVASSIYAFSPAIQKALIAEYTAASVKLAISQSFWWWLIFILLVGGGIYTQIVTTRNFVLVTPEKEL
jgi:Domain of unknown function (DUF4203)